MKMITLLLMLLALLTLLVAGGRSESTNNSAQAGLPVLENGVTTVVPNPRSHKEAIELVSTLKAGTKQQDAEQFLATNHIRFYATFGGSAHWVSVAALSDDTSLNLLYRRSGPGPNEHLDNGLLEAAWIDSTNKLEGASSTFSEGIRNYRKTITLAKMP